MYGPKVHFCLKFKIYKNKKICPPTSAAPSVMHISALGNNVYVLHICNSNITFSIIYQSLYILSLLIIIIISRNDDDDDDDNHNNV